jgi:hypothetical protein
MLLKIYRIDWYFKLFGQDSHSASRGAGKYKKDLPSVAGLKEGSSFTQEFLLHCSRGGQGTRKPYLRQVANH